MVNKERLEKKESQKVTFRVGDAYYNKRRKTNEVVVSADSNIPGPTFGAANYWYQNELLHIGVNGTTDTQDYDWNKRLATFTKEEVIEGSLRGAGLYDPGVTEAERVEVREYFSKGIDEAGLEKKIQ